MNELWRVTVNEPGSMWDGLTLIGRWSDVLSGYAVYTDAGERLTERLSRDEVFRLYRSILRTNVA